MGGPVQGAKRDGSKLVGSNGFPRDRSRHVFNAHGVPHNLLIEPQRVQRHRHAAQEVVVGQRVFVENGKIQSLVWIIVEDRKCHDCVELRC